MILTNTQAPVRFFLLLFVKLTKARYYINILFLVVNEEEKNRNYGIGIFDFFLHHKTNNKMNKKKSYVIYATTTDKQEAKKRERLLALVLSRIDH